MKKIYLLSLGILGLASISMAQSQLKPQFDEKPYNVISESNNWNNGGQRGTETCIDTSRWAWGRSFTGTPLAPSYFAVFMHSDTLIPNSFGTYVDVPPGTNLDVSGFTFLGSSQRPDGNAVTVNAVIYAAGADSLPMGSALGTIPVSLDTSSNLLFQNAVFTTPITVSGSFILSIENSTTQGDSIIIGRGYTGSGVADDFPAIYKAIDLAGGNYTRLPGTNFGARLPHYYPHVSFSQSNSFTMSTLQLTSPNETVNFTYIEPTITGHPVWSLSGFVGDTTSTWSFDGGTTEVKARSTSHTFVDETIDYNIILTDSILLWNGSRCILTESKTLLKADPNGITSIDEDEFYAYSAQGVLHVFNGEGSAKLYSITGSLQKQIALTSKNQSVDVSDLNEGVYILLVNDKSIRIKL